MKCKFDVVNLEKFSVQELSLEEQQTIEGGIWPVILAVAIILACVYGDSER